VLRNRKSDLPARVRVEGIERSILKSVLFTKEDEAVDELARTRATKEYADRKAEEVRRAEHHANPPEPLEELEL
jgi:hypothetical protein